MEHDPTPAASKESAIRQHTERTTHDIHPRYGEILERNETNYTQRIFLESLHSKIDKNSVNVRIGFPRAYVPLLRSLGNQNMKQWFWILNSLSPEEEPEIRFENLGNLFKFRSVLNPFLAFYKIMNIDCQKNNIPIIIAVYYVCVTTHGLGEKFFVHCSRRWVVLMDETIR